MAFWLADRRDGQQADWIPRVDPRFWTVDFPRPIWMTCGRLAPVAGRSRLRCATARVTGLGRWVNKYRVPAKSDACAVTAANTSVRLGGGPSPPGSLTRSRRHHRPAK